MPVLTTHILPRSLQSKKTYDYLDLLYAIFLRMLDSTATVATECGNTEAEDHECLMKECCSNWTEAIMIGWKGEAPAWHLFLL
jgi:hypothetical protein